MLDDIVRNIEDIVGTDDFDFMVEEYVEQLETENIGIEAVTPILMIMERHPLEDFGVPGALVHFAEKFYRNGYEEKLVESLKRRPSIHTVWMLNRIINGGENAEEYLKLMEDISSRSDIEYEIRNSAKESVAFNN